MRGDAALRAPTRSVRMCSAFDRSHHADAGPRDPVELKRMTFPQAPTSSPTYFVRLAKNARSTGLLRRSGACSA